MAQHLEDLKKHMPLVDVGSVQLVLSFKNDIYLIKTLKNSFGDLNKCQSARKNDQNGKPLLYSKRRNMSAQTFRSSTQSQMSCYDSDKRSNILVEEEDLFKLNCDGIKPDDTLQLQLVTFVDSSFKDMFIQANGLSCSLQDF